MPTFEAVDHDPFAAPPPSAVATPIGESGQPIPRLTVTPGGGPKLEPVDHDPFATDYGGLAKAGGIGVAKGAIGLAGLPGDLQTLAGKAGTWLREHIPNLPEPSEESKQLAERYGGRGDLGPSFPLPSSETIQGLVEKVTGPFRKPQNQGEKDAELAGEFLPAALLGPGSIARKALINPITQAAVPATAAIVAGRYSDQNPYVKALAGFVAGGAGAMLSGPSSAEQILRSKIPASVTEQDITRAGQLIEHGQARGVALTWPEALSRVTGQPVLTDTQRILESHGQTRAAMGDFFAGRPEQVASATLSGIDRVGAAHPNPSSLGREAGEAAGKVVKDVRGQITAASAPFYKAAESELLTPQEMALVKKIPGFQAARDAVRNGPNAWRVEHLPDESIGFLNAVKKHFDRLAKTAGSKINPYRDVETEATHKMQASAVKQVGELKSQDYAVALGVQAQLREQILQPLLDGPIGQLAKKDITTQKAINALFPLNPVANEGEIRSAVYSIAQKRPAVAEQLVAKHAEMTFNHAMTELQGGANQFAGARFQKEIAGNPQQRSNLKAAVEALPNGKVRWEGFERLLDIMAATGQRQPKGSLTAFNELEIQSMTSGGLQSMAATAASPGKWMSFAKDTFRSWSLGRNLDGMARLITDPRAVEAFRQIIRVPPGSDRALVMAGRLFNQAGAATTEQRNQPAQNQGR